MGWLAEVLLCTAWEYVTMKFIPLVLFVVGACVLLHSMLRDAKNSFDDGTFLIQMIEMFGGVGLMIVAIIWFSVLIFLAM